MLFLNAIDAVDIKHVGADRFDFDEEWHEICAGQSHEGSE
jgi:hypothetical protein